MTFRLAALPLVALAALVALVGPATTIVPAGATPPAVSSAGAPPPPQIAEFTGAITTELTSSAVNEWGEIDRETTQATAAMTGAIGTVRFVDGRLAGSWEGSVTPGAATASVVEVTDDGGFTKTCDGGPLRTVGLPPTLLPVQGRAVFSPFHAAKIDMQCVVTEGEGGPESYDLTDPTFHLQIPADVMTRRRIVWQLERTIEYSIFSAEECPRSHDLGHLTRCTYTVRSTLTLTRKGAVGDGRPACRAPSRTRLADGERAVSTRLHCEQETTAVVTLRALRGSSTVLARSQVTLPARREREVRVALDRRDRAVVRRAGGVRVEVVYRLGSWTRTFNETVRVGRSGRG